MPTTTQTTARPHQWEYAGLGLAPFRYSGMEEKWFGGGTSGIPRKPGSSCDACGQSIAIVCWIESADGQRFKVGCDCVRKVDNARNKRAAEPVVVAMDRDRRKLQADKRHAREDTKLEAGLAMINENRDLLASMPHPMKQWAERGQTLLDQVDWFLRSAGTTGKLRIIREVEAALKAEEEADVQLSGK